MFNTYYFSVRHPQHSKWHVTLEEYPYRLWPPYPTGGAFFMPFETAERVQAAMPYVKSFRIDDVYVGLIAWKLKVGTDTVIQS